MTYQSLQKIGNEPEYQQTPPLKVSSIGTENTKKNSSRMPYGSVILTGVGSASNSLKNESITHIIHAAMIPLGGDESAFIKVATLAIQNAIFLVEREKVDNKLATCFLGGKIYCPVEEVKPRLAEAIIWAGLKELENCSHLEEVIFVDYDGDYYKNALNKIKKSSDCPENIGHVRTKRGNFLQKSLHSAGIIINSENAEMGWGGGVSGNIKIALGAEASAVDAERKDLMKKFNDLIKEGGEKYTCPQCGKEYNTKDKPPVRECCSRACDEAHWKDKKCSYCSKKISNNLYSNVNTNKFYCSSECMANGEKPNEKKICAYCSKVIKDGERWGKYNDKTYHLGECWDKAVGETPTNNLNSIRQVAISAIQQALNLEPKITTSDLLSDYQNWEKTINQQLNSESEINEFKEKVLADIQNKRQSKQEAADRDQKINQARTTEEKINVLGEMGSSLGEHTSEQQTKLEQIKNDLAANPVQLREAIQKEINSQMTAFKVKESDLGLDIKNQLEQLKNEVSSTKIRQIEKTVIQAVGKKFAQQTLNKLKQKVVIVLKSKEKTKTQELKNELLKVISSPNSFLQAEKSQFQVLFQQLEQGQSSNDTPSQNQPKFPLKSVILVSLVLVAGVISLVIIFKKSGRKRRIQ